MVRFYFDLREGDHVLPDDIGTDLEGVEAAERMAKISLAAMVKDWLALGSRQAFALDVLDQHRRHLMTVRASMTVERVRITPCMEQPVALS